MGVLNDTPTPSERAAAWMERRSGAFILVVVALTALLVVPMIVLAPDEQASDSPGGEVYDLENLYIQNLPPRFHGVLFIAEARGDDSLARVPLLELYTNASRLREADRKGELRPPGLEAQPYLFSGFDVDRQRPVVGIFTIADAVQEVLANHPRLATTLEDASEEEVKLAVHHVFSDPRTSEMEIFLSQKKRVERRTVLGREIDYWTSPALTFGVAADNDKLGGGALRIGATSDPVTEGKEHFNRNAQRILRGDQSSYQLWGVAIDAGLEIADEVGTAVPFIMLTFVMVLIVVGISLRSLRVVLLTALGLAAMIIWLKGLSNLVGLRSSTTLDFIVPIAMISLGADFVIHAVSRYREERRVVADARRAFRLGMAGVLMALVLAMVTDAIAFLSNASARVETVFGFGIGAGLAIFAAFVIMGLTIPMVLMRWDALRARNGTMANASEPDRQPSDGARTGSSALADVVVALARWRLAVIPIAALVTAVSGYYAFRLEARFDVEDFFKSGSDFTVGLDKIDDHVGDSGGEPAIVYIEGDLADPEALSAVQEFMVRVGDNPYVAKTDDETALIQRRTVFNIFDQAMRSDYARAEIERASGVAILADEGVLEFPYGDRVYRRPGSREQLEAILDYASVNGVPLTPEQDVYDRLDVGEAVFHDRSGARLDATAVVLGVPGTREQTNVVRSREALGVEIERLEAAALSISRVGLTGSPYTRQAALDATTSGLQRALVIAVIACLVVAVVAMRSVRFGVVTIIPIGLVVAWLYAFMYLFGFGLNFVTATIAAISIGVGIDYAIHITQRFREELARAPDRTEALRRAAQGTGVALVASAATSVLGFTIMGFAPMPMFSSYGILTAVMIFLAAAASLLVLPSLLLFVSPAEPAQETASGASAPAD